MIDRTNPDTHPAGCQCAACTAYCPTPEEIRAKCAEIQAGWSKATELARRAIEPRDWEPPSTYFGFATRKRKREN